MEEETESKVKVKQAESVAVRHRMERSRTESETERGTMAVYVANCYDLARTAAPQRKRMRTGHGTQGFGDDAGVGIGLKDTPWHGPMLSAI